MGRGFPSVFTCSTDKLPIVIELFHFGYFFFSVAY